jgi:hypothetical protein
VSLQAVLFSGGSSWGDSATVARILRRRGYMEESLQESLTELNAAVVGGTAKASLIGQFQSALASEQAAAADSDQQVCIQSVRGVVLKNLQAVTPGRTPEPLPTLLARQIGSLQSRLSAVQNGGGGQ